MSDPAHIYEADLVPVIFGPLARMAVEMARPLPGERVLDAACGTGIVARAVAQVVGPTGHVTGLDFDPLMIAKAKTLDAGITWREGDLQDLPFEDGAFDLALCQQGLQFLPDRARGLGELHRVLRGHGRMMLSVWTELARSPGQAILFDVLAELLGTSPARPPAWSLTDEAQIAELVSAAGFSDIEIKVASLQTVYPSARRFIEIILDGSSKLTRQALAQLPADRRNAFMDEVARRLDRYQAGTGLDLPMETRLILAHKR